MKPSIAKWSDLKYILIAVFPILSLYEFIPLLDVGLFLLLLIVVLKVIKQNLVSQINIEIFYTMLALIILNILVGAFKYPDITNTLNNSAGMIVFTIPAIFLCCPGYLEKDRFYQACKIVGLIATIFLFYQSFSYNILDVIIKGNLPFLTPLESGFVSIEYGRPTSFFYEPAHYCIYIAPIYAMSIIKKEYWLAMILFLGVVLSTSTTGIFLMLIIPLIIYIRKAKSIAFIGVFIVAGLLLFIYLPDIFNQYLSKLSLTSLMDNIRILGTLTYFQYFSLPEWLFGVGINRLAEFLLMNGETYGRNYANSMIFLFFSFGIVGAVFWLNLCIVMFKKIAANYRVMWYILVFVLLSDQILFNRNLLYLLIWVYIVYRETLRKYDESSISIESTILIKP